MTKFRLTFTWRQFLYGLAFGLIAFSLAACSGAPQPSGPRVWGSVGIGTSKSKGTVESDSLNGRGGVVTVRGELVQPIDYVPDFEVGLRFGLAGRDAQSTADGIEVDAQSGEASLAGVLRQLVPLSREGGLSFYGEGFAGYAHNWGTVQGGPIAERDNGGGILYGAGAGLDFGTGLRLGVEWSRRDFEIAPVEIQADDLMLVVGGVLRF